MRRLLLPALILAALLIGYLLGERRSPSQLWQSMTRPSTGPTGLNDSALEASLPKRCPRQLQGLFLCHFQAQ